MSAKKAKTSHDDSPALPGSKCEKNDWDILVGIIAWHGLRSACFENFVRQHVKDSDNISDSGEIVGWEIAHLANQIRN
ncbi:hypothetical protein ACHAXR_012795 [Thalassiosira sp. AJA248-18]